MGYYYPMGQIKIKDQVILYSDSCQKYIDGWRWHLHKTKHGIYVRGYPVGRRRDGLYYMHRVISRARGGEDVDHINGNGLDNRIENLRVCSRTQNNGNRRKIAKKSSKYKGVHFDKQTNKWRAEITHEGKRIRLGRFKTEKEAVNAYYQKAKELFKEYALLSFR